MSSVPEFPSEDTVKSSTLSIGIGVALSEGTRKVAHPASMVMQDMTLKVAIVFNR